MLKQELIYDGAFIKTYSDAGRQIRQVDTGLIYDEAIDPAPTTHEYEETEENETEGGKYNG